MGYDYRDPAIRAKARAAAALLGEPAATELRAVLDALDVAEVSLAHEIREHEASRVALREAIEDLARVRAAAEADDETMRAIARIDALLAGVPDGR